MCRKWKEIALHTALLWSGLKLVFKSPPQADIEGKALQIWLQRAGACSHSLSFTWINCFPRTVDAITDIEGVYDSLGLITEVIRPLIRQCRCLRLEAPLHYSRVLTKCFADGMPLLQNLDVSRAFRQEEVCLDLSKCSRLKVIKLVLKSSPMPIVEVGQTIFYDLGDVTLTDNMDVACLILSRSPRLKRCTLCLQQTTTLASTLFLSSPLLYLPDLTDLHIFSYPGQDVSVIVDRIDFPSLKTLTLKNFGGTDPPLAAMRILSTLMRSRPPLEYLAMAGIMNKSEDFLLALQVLPNLKSLYFTMNGRFDDVFWMALTRSHSAEKAIDCSLGDLCPELEKLVLHGFDIVDREIPLIRSMVMSRSQGRRDCPLRYLCLGGCTFSKEDLAGTCDFQRCLNAGLTLEVINWTSGD